MAMIGVRIAALGLALAVLCPSQQAWRFRAAIGTVLIGLAGNHHHHRHLVRRPTEALHSEATPTDVAQNRAPSLLYPILTWPSFADDIFRPTNYSPWPFSYQSIFDQAFAEYPAKRVAELCTRQIGKSRCHSTHRARDRADRRATAAATKTRHGPCASQRLFDQALSG